MFRKLLIALTFALSGLKFTACDLCSIYNAESNLGTPLTGFSAAISEQYIPYETTQFDSREIKMRNAGFVDSSITHLTLSYNFLDRAGVSFGLPFNYLDFKRTDLLYSLSGPPVLITERGRDFGIGDASLIGRLNVLQMREMTWAVLVNLFAGVKFPTGDSSRLDDEVSQSKIFASLLPPGTPHDPLGHSISGVHQHSLAMGSGSYDGIFGAALNSRWSRYILSAQFQYYLKSEGEAGFRYGDEILVTGGPGAYLLMQRLTTLSLQFNTTYDSMGRDSLLSTASDRTGGTSWYAGPLLILSYGVHFTANTGFDWPLRIQNNGLQVVPDYRIHCGLNWHF